MIAPEPWIHYFRKSVGQPSLFSPNPRPIVIDQPNTSKPATAGEKGNLPINVISPLEQTNQMAMAELKNSKNAVTGSRGSLSTEKRKRKPPQPKTKGKKTAVKRGPGRASKRKHKSGTKPGSSKSTNKTRANGRRLVATKIAPKKGKNKSLTVTGHKARDIFSDRGDQQHQQQQQSEQ